MNPNDKPNNGVSPSTEQPVETTSQAVPNVQAPHVTTPTEPTESTGASQFRQNREKREAGYLVSIDGDMVVRIRRPSISNLVKTGQLPLELANAAIKVESGGNIADADVKKFTQYQERLIRLSMVSPSVVDEPDYDADQIGINDLTDTQQTEIVMYVNGGLEALAKFRERGQSVSTGPDQQAI